MYVSSPPLTTHINTFFNGKLAEAYYNEKMSRNWNVSFTNLKNITLYCIIVIVIPRNKKSPLSCNDTFKLRLFRDAALVQTQKKPVGHVWVAFRRTTLYYAKMGVVAAAKGRLCHE